MSKKSSANRKRNRLLTQIKGILESDTVAYDNGDVVVSPRLHQVFYENTIKMKVYYALQGVDACSPEACEELLAKVLHDIQGDARALVEDVIEKVKQNVEKTPTCSV